MTNHKSVLYKETLEALDIQPGEIYIDATLNGGGHTRGILEAGGRVLGIDIDPQAIKRVAREYGLEIVEQDKRLAAASKALTLSQGNFVLMRDIAAKRGVWETPGVLFDLGLSSLQLDDAERGFSFNKSGPLDMRMDPNLSVTAADLINGLNEGELYELFTKFGEEYANRSSASAIVKARINKKIETTTQLSEIIQHSTKRRGKIHPATRIFQALRIAVNDELNNLKKGLEEATLLLNKNGKLVVISFHSLEDRIVKNFFKEDERLRVLTKTPTVPSRKEILDNPRSRSAKMRVAQRI